MMSVEGTLRARRRRDPAAVPGHRPAVRRDARRLARGGVAPRPGHRRAAALQHHRGARADRAADRPRPRPRFRVRARPRGARHRPRRQGPRAASCSAPASTSTRPGTRAAATTAVMARAVSLPLNPFHLDLRPALHVGRRARADRHTPVRGPRAEPHREERLMRYASLGRIPAKRHVQYRDPDANGNAPLLVEEVMGFEGFSGNESILYHLFSPCRVKEVGDFERIELEEWVPETHVHRLTHTMELEPMGDTRARPARAPVQRRRRDRDLRPRARGGLLLPRRRGRRGHLRPRGLGRRGDDLRHAPVPQARLHRDPARDDVPVPRSTSPSAG